MSALARAQREFLAALPAVHRANIAANLAGALGAAYPVVARIVGPAFFGEAAQRFGAADPPRSGDLNMYGAGFPDFLASYPHAASLPYLPDVARLEWACHEAAQAPDAPAFDFAALARIGEGERPSIVFTLQPAARIVASAWRAGAIWLAHRDGDGALASIEGPEVALVWRGENIVGVEVLAAPEGAFLAAIVRGATLGEAAGLITESDAPRVLGESLRGFVARGVIGGFRLAA